MCELEKFADIAVIFSHHLCTFGLAKSIFALAYADLFILLSSILIKFGLYNCNAILKDYF